jgi:hypothetical protein
MKNSITYFIELFLWLMGLNVQSTQNRGGPWSAVNKCYFYNIRNWSSFLKKYLSPLILPLVLRAYETKRDEPEDTQTRSSYKQEDVEQHPSASPVLGTFPSLPLLILTEVCSPYFNMPVTLATLKAEIGGSWFKASLGK